MQHKAFSETDWRRAGGQGIRFQYSRSAVCTSLI